MQNPTHSEYFHYKSLFVQNFQHILITDLNLQSIFRVGLQGQPVMDFTPGVFFKPRFILSRAAARQAHLFFPELYRNYINKRSKLAIDQADKEIITSLVLYAVWRYIPEWIYSLSDLVRENKISGPIADKILQIACILSFLQGEKQRFMMIKAGICRTEPVFDLFIKFFTGQDCSNENTQYDANVSVKKIMWTQHALNREIEEEKTFVQRIIKEEPADTRRLYDIYSSLIHRGFVFLAVRYLMRYQKKFDQDQFIFRIILNQYLLNAKYLLYLRRLGKIKEIPSRWCWFEARYCIAMLDADDIADELMDQVFNNKSEQSMEGFESHKYRFENMIQAAAEGLKTGDLTDAWQNTLIKSVCLKSAKTSLRVQESFVVFEKIIFNKGHKRTGWNNEQIAIFFPNLNDKFMLYSAKKSVQNIWLILQSLGSRILCIRIHLGFMAFQRGYHEVARKYLENQVVILDEQLHELAQIEQDQGNLESAIEIYNRLLLRTPNHAVYHYNLGLLYEKSCQTDMAIKEFARALELEPGYNRARDRIEILK